MSDNPYERDNPDEPVEPGSTADGTGAQPTWAEDDGVASADTPAAATEPLTTAPAGASPTAASPADAARTEPVAPTADEPAEQPDDVPADAADPYDDAATAPADELPADPYDDVATERHADELSADPYDDVATARHDAAPAPTQAAASDPDGAVTSTFDVREAERTRPTGTHEAERPVPRSGLAEHNSAGYLTGKQLPLRQDAELTDSGRTDTDTGDTGDTRDTAGSATWLSGGATGAAAGGTAAAGGAAAAGRPAPDDDRTTTTTTADRTRADRDVVLEGTTAVTRPPSRARAHVWTVILTLLLTPVAWYLLADAGARLTLPQGNPWETGNLNVAALLELGGGLLVLVVVLLAARWSSLGAIITGSLVLVVGVPFVAVPTWTQELLEPVVEWLDGLGDFGGNVAHHLVASGSTGRLVGYGLALIFLGVVSHGARRQGRREVRPVAEAV